MTAIPADGQPLPHSYTPGSARAALSYPAFRLVWIGMSLSSVGTWMQNVTLPAYIHGRTGSARLVGVMLFAQLGPMLVLAIPAGVVAARVSRRKLLVGANLLQLAGSLTLAYLVSRDASFRALFVANLVIGVANATGAPAFQSSIPLLVDRRDLPGAISLNSVQLNGTRVIGPVIAALLLSSGFTIPQIFVINALTYLFMVASVVRVRFPSVTGRVAEQGWRQLTSGIRIARGSWVLGRLLLAMTALSFFTLTFVGLFPAIADEAFGIDPLSSTYGWLYATWGFGACLGALASGTVLARVDKRTLIRPGIVGMCLSLAVFALISSKILAFPVGFVLGAFYFLMATAMVTVLQVSMADHERAYVMPLWFMSFGGMVPLGNMAFGAVMDRIGPRPVLIGGALVGVAVAYSTDFTRPTA